MMFEGILDTSRPCRISFYESGPFSNSGSGCCRPALVRGSLGRNVVLSKRAFRKFSLSERRGFLEQKRFEGLESRKQKQRLMEPELKAAAGSAELVSTHVFF